MRLRQRGYLTEQSEGGLSWKKVQRKGVLKARGNGQNIWSWATESGKDKWMLMQTNAHPEKDFDHDYKRMFWQIYRNGKPFQKPVNNLETAKITVEKWVKEYGI